MIGDVLVRVTADISDFTKGINSAVGQLQDFSRNMSQMAAIAGTAMAVGVGAAVKTSADFEAQISRVGAIAGATSTELEELRQSALELGASTSKSAAEVAQAQENLAALGFTATEIIAAMPGVISAAEASGADMAQTADVVASALNIWGLEAGEASRVADILAQTANQSAADITDMQYALKYAGAPASALGISLEELAASIGHMTDRGLSGENAGTALRASLLALLNPSEKNTKAMEALGVSVTDAEGNFIGISGVVEEFNKALEGQTDTQKAATLAQLVGTEAVSGFLALMEAGPSEIDKMTASLEDSAGASAETAKQMKDNLKGAIEELMGAFETMKITIGAALTPAIIAVTNVVRDMINAFNGLPDELQTTFAILAAITPIALLFGAGILYIISVLPGLIAGLGIIAGVLGISVGAFVGISAAILALVPVIIGLAVAITKNWDTIKSATASLFTDFSGTMGKLGTLIAETASTIGAKAAELGQSLYNMLPPGVQSVIGAGIEAISGFLSKLKTVFNDAIAGDFSSLGNLVAGLIPTIVGALVGGLPGLLIAGSRFLPAISEGITSNINMISEKANEIISALLTGITTYLPMILTAGVQLIQTILDGIVTALPLVIEGITSLITFIITAIAENLPMILEAGATILTTLLQGLVTALPVIIEVVTTLISTITMTIAALLPLIIQAGIELLVALINGIVQALPQIIETVMTLITTLINTIVELLPIIIEAGIQIVTALINGLVSSLPQIIDAILLLVTSLIDVIVQNLPMIIDAGVQILLALVQGVIDALPQLIDAALLLIISVVGAIIDNLPQILEAGVQLLLALIDGIIQIIPELISAIIEIIGVIIDTLIDHLPELLEMGGELILALIDGVLDLLGDVGSAALDIGGEILDGIGSIIGDMIDIGADIVNGLIEGIQSIDLGSVIAGLADKIPDWIKKPLGIHSPSRVMAKEVGRWIPPGIGVGMTDAMGSVLKSAERMADEITSAATPTMPAIDSLNMEKFESGMRSSSLRAMETAANMELSGAGGSGDTYNISMPLEYHGPATRESMTEMAKFTVKYLEREIRAEGARRGVTGAVNEVNARSRRALDRY
ncbi:phage tail tape measure protein [Terribacillus sp. 179-K 1B1 HS]|uniref:phage tail tape measure protein n=1 Tax=Terribacillus sp. 179-K 1B1 HS TaxID=3142388 RepID=UPI0039A12C57